MGLDFLLMSSPAEIDVLMAVFNGANFLEEQILSIYNQTLRPTKLIVRDDCSEDNSIQILSSFSKLWPDWFYLLPSENRLGCSGNFGKLLQASTAQYIALADQDDIWKENKIQISFDQCLREEARIGSHIPILIHSNLELIDESGQLLNKSFTSPQTINKLRKNNDSLFVQNVVTGCTTFMNRSLINKALPIPHEYVLHDWWLALVASKFGSILFINNSLVSYRQHSNNLIGAKSFVLHTLYKKLLEFDFFYGQRRINYYYKQAYTFYIRYGGEIPLLLKFHRLNLLEKFNVLIFGGLKMKGFIRHIVFMFFMLFFRTSKSLISKDQAIVTK